MRMVRLAVLAVIAVAVGGAGYVYRDEVAQKLGWGASASAAEKDGAASPAASAQPQGRRGRLEPGRAGSRGRHQGRQEAAADHDRGGRHRAGHRLDPDQVAHRQPDHEGECRGRRAGEGGRHPVRARFAHAAGAARPDRGADPQGPGPGRPGQARRVALRGAAVQECRHGGQPRHRPDHAQGRRGAARGRRGRQGERRDPDHLHRHPRAGVGPYRLDLEQGRHRDPRRRQQRRERARHHQPDRPDLRRLRRPAGFPARHPRRDGQGRRQGHRHHRRQPQAVGCHRLPREQRRSR